ncbi:TOBE domain-containing protein, partial [Streptomyces sp. NPDC005349]|uniref:TOBE domain-containing protein n=1 Tax=Streptomyces sp. NPDC005349 TaxID=3157037 RepID=UPI0033AEA792
QIRADLTGELALAADLTTVAAAELNLHPGAPAWASTCGLRISEYVANDSRPLVVS